MIYCFGNSHAAIFTGAPPCGNKVPRVKLGITQCNPDHPSFYTIFLGPIIAYNFKEKHLPALCGYLINANRETDRVLVCVGEVDCRYHLAKRIMDGEGSIKDMVKSCVDRYFEGISILIADGWKVTLAGTHPTTREPHCEDLDKPHWGDCAFRNSICVEWNLRLKETCQAGGATFVSIYDQLVDADNLTISDYFVDYCHLSYDKCFPLLLKEMQSEGVVETT